jgi:hypothetical protein
MRRRSGFARLRPLIAIAALAAGTVALLASARTAQEPMTLIIAPPFPVEPTLSRPDGGCSDAYPPDPAHGVVDADGRRWELADMPGHTLRGLDLRNAVWVEVDLRGASFEHCDFRGAALNGANLEGASFTECNLRDSDLRGANLRSVTFYNTDLSGASLDGAEFTNAEDILGWSGRGTIWPAGFKPDAHGIAWVP